MDRTTNWEVIASPSHQPTELRIEARQERGGQGKFLLVAFDGRRWVHSQFFNWDRWAGHGMGLLLMPGFIKAAEKAAKLQRGNAQ